MSARRSSRVQLAVVAVVSMLVGALVATGVALYLTRDQREYVVTAYLRVDATEEQKAEVQAAMTGLKPAGEIEFENRDEAWRKFQEYFKDQPELLATGRREAMPESFRLTTADTAFTCSLLDPIRDLDGVDELHVHQKPNDEVLPATIFCY
ncbi:permease-like cell division protein FtsX [Actinophytocola xanthii]|uniref:FtsX extracellular domain-containing protein n=1 Tax=Actinophytocola xanthii TaxID=1912961 RepID=A0A1Q8C3F8_9PSEU|nr:permease-like cell division protein FtsX [Actinophytocola xanthii]OLF08895.1 hypothetical protein BU204_33755 [Actinophytocola xanthii]